MYKSGSEKQLSLQYTVKEKSFMRMNERSGAVCDMCKQQEIRFRRSEQPFPDDYSVAMAYVPVQTDTTVYDEMQALCEGTLFAALNKPFMRGCKQ